MFSPVLFGVDFPASFSGFVMVLMDWLCTEATAKLYFAVSGDLLIDWSHRPDYTKAIQQIASEPQLSWLSQNKTYNQRFRHAHHFLMVSGCAIRLYSFRTVGRTGSLVAVQLGWHMSAFHLFQLLWSAAYHTTYAILMRRLNKQGFRKWKLSSDSLLVENHRKLLLECRMKCGFWGTVEISTLSSKENLYGRTPLKSVKELRG